VLEAPPTPRLRLAVHSDAAFLDEQLGVTARDGSAGELEERAELGGSGDLDVLQELRRIGMMR
jgi:hypothetical protein